MVCAGRTDRGVHATGQVIHFDLPTNFSHDKIMLAINYFLKKYSISVCKAQNLGKNSNFHARFSAKARYYRYLILLQNHKPTFSSHLFWWQNKDLDHKYMNDAAQILLGTHDFTSFRSKSCSAATPIKTINKIEIYKNYNIITINILAPSFLYHQVRFIVGALTKIGLKKWSKEKLKSILLARDNTKNTAIAPPNGLYLVKVFY